MLEKNLREGHIALGGGRVDIHGSGCGCQRLLSVTHFATSHRTGQGKVAQGLIVGRDNIQGLTRGTRCEKISVAAAAGVNGR